MCGGEALPIGSLHSMYGSELPSPSWSSEPVSKTRGQKRLPDVSTVLKSPCLTSTLSPHKNLAAKLSMQLQAQATN